MLPRPLQLLPGIAAFLLAVPFLPAQNTTTRASVATGGVQADRSSNRASLAAYGRFLSFESNATNLVVGDLNFVQDVFLRDMLLGTTERVSVGPGGLQANGESKRSTLSGDGGRVAYTSLASNLVALDLNLTYDIFVYDRLSGVTTRVSESTLGVEANNLSTRPAISADGNCVAYRSLASNLVANDFNLIDDVFVRDLTTGVTERLSLSTAGVEGNATSDRPTISGDGTRVAFWSDADNFVPGDLPLTRDIFMRDRVNAETILISISTLGLPGNGPSSRPSISLDGRFVAFTSDASDLVAGDTNLAGDVFVRDTLLGTTERVSVATGGGQSNALASVPSISGDGRFVAFRSIASNLVANDWNNNEDVFLHDRQTGTTTLVSLSDANVLGAGLSTRPSISADGGSIAYQSTAANLVAGDTNLVEDVFVHEGVGGVPVPSKDIILLSGPTLVGVGTQVTWTWSQAPATSPWWMAYSFTLTGSVIAGHGFDLGQPASVAARGMTDALGSGSFLSPPIPVSLTGRTVFLEVASRDSAGNFLDSNPLTVSFF
ncbi:MAG: PD40 domain-containing protein [Planctomycetes bacterium]|nr:PD40 domain-containing protein [Planctomycetota bacterium]